MKVNFNSLPKEKQNDIIELLQKINLQKDEVDIIRDGNKLKASVIATGHTYTLLFD